MRLNEIVKKIFKGILKTSSRKEENNIDLTFISNEEEVILEQVRCNRVWYGGNSSELLNYYFNFEVKGFAKNPIYNRNNRNSFWGLSSVECNIKRVHSGLPRAMVDTMCGIIDIPTYECKDKEKLKEILDYNNFEYKLMQKSRPLTLVEGWGGYKINVNKKFDYPIIEYYGAEDVKYCVDNSLIVGMIFKTTFLYDSRKFILLESRSIEEHNLIIRFSIFKETNSNGDLEKATYTDAGLKNEDYEDIIIPKLNNMLAVPSRYFYDAIHGDAYGRSFYDGIVDLFDDLDEAMSISSRAARLSTPVEYIDVEMLEKDSQGNFIVPKRYDRSYVKTNGIINSDGGTNSQTGILATQPKINMDQYNNRIIALQTSILNGRMSPATMGMELSRKDNANAQREKEKVTSITRQNIIRAEEKMLKQLYTYVLQADEYLHSGTINNIDKKYDISISYKEFASPNYEDELEVLLKGLVQKGLSPEMFVEKLYRDKITKEEKAREIKFISKQIELNNKVFEGLDNDRDSKEKTKTNKETKSDKN